MATSPFERQEPRADRTETRGEALPVIEHVTGNYTFEYRGHSYGAEFASDEDINAILRGIREGVEKEEDAEALALGQDVQGTPSEEAILQAGKKAHSVVENSARVIGNDYTKVKDYFRGLLNENSVLPGAHTKGLFKLKAGAADVLFRKYTGSFENADLHPALTSKNYFMNKECFVMSEQDGDGLKQLLKNLNSERFKIATEFEDGFVAYFNGLEIPFLCPPENEFIKSGEEVDEKPDAAPDKKMPN